MLMCHSQNTNGPITPSSVSSIESPVGGGSIQVRPSQIPTQPLPYPHSEFPARVSPMGNARAIPPPAPDPDTILDLQHSATALVRVLLRLKGFDQEENLLIAPSLEDQPKVYPSDAFIVQFSARSLPHLISRILRAVKERADQLKSMGVASMLPEIHKELLVLGEEWQVQVMKLVGESSGLTKRAAWLQIEESGLCERLAACAAKTRRAFF